MCVRLHRMRSLPSRQLRNMICSLLNTTHRRIGGLPPAFLFQWAAGTILFIPMICNI